MEQPDFEFLDLKSYVQDARGQTNFNHFAPRRVTCKTLIFIESNQGKITLDFCEYVVKSDNCLFISKGQVIRFYANETYSGYVVQFGEIFVQKYLSLRAHAVLQWLFDYQVHSVLQPIVKEGVEFVNAIKSEIDFSQSQPNKDILASLLAFFCFQMNRACFKNMRPIEYQSRKYERFALFEHHLRASYNLTRDAQSYANFLGISYKYLNEICKELTNITAKEFIDNFILMEAKRQLVSTIFTVNKISYNCGFDDSTNFVKYFKKRVGVTPAVFRKG